MHTKNRIEADILKELNVSDVELFDNQNLIAFLDESEKTTASIRKLEQQTKVGKKR